MGPINTAESAIATAGRSFESIGDRLKLIAVHVGEAIAHPFCPPGLKAGVPALLDVVEDLRQEVAELRKPCPCEGNGVTRSGPGSYVVDFTKATPQEGAAAPIAAASDAAPSIAGTATMELPLGAPAVVRSVLVDGEELPAEALAEFEAWRASRAPGASAGAAARAAQDATNGQA